MAATTADKIRTHLLQNDREVTLGELVTATGLRAAVLRDRLSKLCSTGEAKRTGPGLYRAGEPKAPAPDVNAHVYAFIHRKRTFKAPEMQFYKIPRTRYSKVLTALRKDGILAARREGNDTIWTLRNPDEFYRRFILGKEA